MHRSRLRVEGLGCGVQGSGFRVLHSRRTRLDPGGLGHCVDLGLWSSCVEFRVRAQEFESRVSGVG